MQINVTFFIRVSFYFLRFLTSTRYLSVKVKPFKAGLTKEAYIFARSLDNAEMSTHYQRLSRLVAIIDWDNECLTFKIKFYTAKHFTTSETKRKNVNLDFNWLLNSGKIYVTFWKDKLKNVWECHCLLTGSTREWRKDRYMCRNLGSCRPWALSEVHLCRPKAACFIPLNGEAKLTVCSWTRRQVLLISVGNLWERAGSVCKHPRGESCRYVWSVLYILSKSAQSPG